MHILDVELNAGAFSHPVVVATAHRYSDRFTVSISRVADSWQLRFEALEPVPSPEALRDAIMRDALDEQLRDLVRARTVGLQETLLSAALLGAIPKAAT